MVGMNTRERIAQSTLRTMTLYIAILLVLVMALFLVSATDEVEGSSTKDITMYFHNVTNSKQIGDAATLRIMNTTQGVDGLTRTVPTMNSVKTNWYLYPSVANDTTVEGKITVHIWAIRTVITGDADRVTLIYDLYDVDERGTRTSKIARGLRTLDSVIEWRQYSVTNDSVAKYTVKKGHYLLLEFELQGSSSNRYQLGWGDSNFRSALVFGSWDYLKIDHAEVQDHLGVADTNFKFDTDNKNVTFRAEVVDPFGGYDIRWVNVTLTGPRDSRILDGPGMTKVSGFFTSYRSAFEYAWDYSGFPSGKYNLTISAVDNSGYYYRFPAHPDDLTYGGHLETLTVFFWIGGPPHPVTITVLDNLTRPLSGSEVMISEVAGVSDAGGNAILMVSNGSYELKVYWQEVLVYERAITINGDTTVAVVAAVYDPLFNVVDDKGEPVEDAVALVEHPNGTILKALGRSNASGTFTLDRMAGGEYHVSLLWLGSLIYDGAVTIDGNGPFTLDGLVFTLDIRVEDDRGTGLELAQVVVFNTSTHIVLDSQLTDKEGNISSRLPLGSYDIYVYWHDSLVHDGTQDHLLAASGYLVLLADIFTVNVTVVDTAEVPLSNAKFVVRFADGSKVLDFGVTDGSGTISTRLAPGVFTFLVYWRDILVNITAGHLVNSHEELLVVGDVHWVPVLVRDALSVSLSGASVVFEHSSGQSFGTRSTGPEGDTTFRLPAGTYSTTVVWSEVQVLNGTVTVDSSELLVLDASVYYLEVRVVDSMGTELEVALVSAELGLTGKLAGDGRTDASGEITFRLPVGPVTLEVTWQDSPVHTGAIEVTANDQVTLTVAVFYATFHTIDSKGIDLVGAQVIAANASTGRPMGSHATDETGEAVFRLPVGLYGLAVSWQDHGVYEGQEAVASNDVHTLECAVHYVGLHLTDSLDMDLAGAQVLIVGASNAQPMGGQLTDAEGLTTFRLPAGDFSVEATWHDVVVLEASIAVGSDDTVVLTASVYYAELHLADSRGKDLEDAHVMVTMPGTVMGSGVTGPEGTATFRVPTGTYRVMALWQEVQVLDVEIAINRSGPVELEAAVVYVAFHAVDSEGADLEDARVSAYNATTDHLLGTGDTDVVGLVELRLPQGFGAIEVGWRSVLVNTTSEILLLDRTTHVVRTRVHYLTVEVLDSDGARVSKVNIDVIWDSEAISSALTDGQGLAVFRLPEGEYTVNMSYRTTYHMTAIDVAKTEKVTLSASMTLRLSMDDSDYPLPFAKTNLFKTILAFIVMLVVLLVLTYLIVLKARGQTLTVDEDGVPEDELDLIDLGSADLEAETESDSLDHEPLRDKVDEAEIELEGKE
jgi:hypothetical protein